MSDQTPDAPPPEARYSTRDVASALGINRASLIRWEGQNLIPKPEWQTFQRPSGGVYRGRLYTKEQFDQIAALVKSKGLGKTEVVAKMPHKSGSAPDLN